MTNFLHYPQIFKSTKFWIGFLKIIVIILTLGKLFHFVFKRKFDYG